jgi:hypothetical protein
MPGRNAGLADQRWTFTEFLTHKTTPRPWLKKQGRGRLSDQLKRWMQRYGF